MKYLRTLSSLSLKYFLGFLNISFRSASHGFAKKVNFAQCIHPLSIRWTSHRKGAGKVLLKILQHYNILHFSLIKGRVKKCVLANLPRASKIIYPTTNILSLMIRSEEVYQTCLNSLKTGHFLFKFKIIVTLTWY